SRPSTPTRTTAIRALSPSPTTTSPRRVPTSSDLPGSASTTTTSSACWSGRVSRSSPGAGTSSWMPSAPRPSREAPGEQQSLLPLGVEHDLGLGLVAVAHHLAHGAQPPLAVTNAVTRPDLGGVDLGGRAGEGGPLGGRPAGRLHLPL